MISYAKVFVEINEAEELVHIRIQLEGGEEMDVDVTYAWVPPICNQCKSFGHIEI